MVHNNNNNNNNNNKIKILSLGDSYTIGECVEANDSWPIQLVNRLKDERIHVSDLKIFAVTGWTTSELTANIKLEIFEPPYDLVTLLIGVNNQYRGEDKTIYRNELTDLIYQAINFAGGNRSRVLVLSIPDWSGVPFAEGRNRTEISSEIDKFNNIKSEQCNLMSVRFLNITPISRKVKEDASLVATDKLHPSAKMYKMWVDLVYPVAINMIKS